MPLPAEAAVSGYAFRIGARRIVGEVDRIAAARERFEEALLEGRTAGLLEQDRSSLFTQELGNIPPGMEVVAELIIDQRLRWLEEGAWGWRFPTVVAPRYLGGPGQVADAPRVTVDVADGPLPVVSHLAFTIGDPLSGAHEMHSPSHGLKIAAVPAGHEIGLAAAGAALDRDLVVHWQSARSHVVATLETGRPAAGRPPADAAYGLLTLTPPLPAARPPALPRDLIVLLDMSGSMAGEPLDQARRVVSRVIDTLGDVDQLEIIGFASEAKRWKPSPRMATASAKRSAVQWLEKLAADGGTEMRVGIAEALRPLRVNAQRQIVLVTDGQIGFESEVVGMIARDLPRSCRLHTVGVGPAVNRTLTSGAARAGRGGEIVVGLGENPMPAVARLLARLELPLLTDLALTGSALLHHVPAGLPDVHAGAPALIGLRLRPEGGELRITGRLGGRQWEEMLSVPAVAAGAGNAAVVACYGREAVEDLEMRVSAGEMAALDQEIETVGLQYQIATRLTSWFAATEEATVDPQQALRRERIPQALPAGLSAAGLGLRAHEAMYHLAMPMVMRMSASVAPRPTASRRLAERVPDAMRGARPRPKRGHELRGRVVLRRYRELVVEITLDRPLAWDPSDARAVWDDGTECGAAIDASRSTRAGAVEAGNVIRLVLRLDETALPSAPARILLVSKSGSLDIVLDP
ncbi:MAG TPA: VIT domain-containing protein [Methylomirabilota bacterium]|nr:VIT domain-containing protein [Methylomirabilota bacterium]